MEQVRQIRNTMLYYTKHGEYVYSIRLNYISDSGLHTFVIRRHCTLARKIALYRKAQIVQNGKEIKSDITIAFTLF